VVDKTKHKKMTDHVAEQIEMKFKAATVPQPQIKTDHENRTPRCTEQGGGLN
jgi:hypothetical protein